MYTQKRIDLAAEALRQFESGYRAGFETLRGVVEGWCDQHRGDLTTADRLTRILSSPEMVKTLDAAVAAAKNEVAAEIREAFGGRAGE